MKTEEKSKYEKMVKIKEKCTKEEITMLKVGSIVNDCILIYNKPYLRNFKLRYSYD